MRRNTGIGGELALCSEKPENQYTEIQDFHKSFLRDHFHFVASPIDPPAEVGPPIGGIQYFVACPKYTFTMGSLDLLATTGKVVSEGPFASTEITKLDDLTYAITTPWLKERCPHHRGQQPPMRATVTVCPNLDDFNWKGFQHAHDALWAIIESTIMPYGLYIHNQGLYIQPNDLCIDYDAAENFEERSETSFFLTSDPDEMLLFLGFPANPFWEEQFQTVHEMYTYVADCPMFCSQPDYPKWPAMNPHQEEAAKKLDKLLFQPSALNHFLTVFKPYCLARGYYIEPRTSPSRVFEHAVNFFHMHAEVYIRSTRISIEEQRHYIWIYMINNFEQLEEPEAKIEEIPRTDYRRRCYRILLVNALKEIILQGGTKYGIKLWKGIRDASGNYHMDVVKDYIIKHHKRIGSTAFALHNDWFLEVRKMARKRDRKIARQRKSAMAAGHYW